MKRSITRALENQFDSTMHMARTLVQVCPEKVWAAGYNGVPFWQQVFHYVWYIDYWMREDHSAPHRQAVDFGEAYSTDLYADSYEGLYIPQGAMLKYIDSIQAKTTRIFAGLDDEKLSLVVYGDEHGDQTYTDVIAGQIRHIMYNIGYLNGILREQGLPESDWYAHNEAEGA